MQVHPHASTHSHCTRPANILSSTPEAKTPESWKNAFSSAFDALQTNVYRGYRRIGTVWKQLQSLHPIRFAINSLTPSRTTPSSTLELLPNDPLITCKTLPNGFTYYLRHNDYLSKNEAYIQLVVKTGYLNETKEELGVAHLVEHLLCARRTACYPSDEAKQYFASKGILWGTGHTNASTGHRYTEYHLKIPLQDTETLDKTLHIFSEMAFHSILRDDYIQKEKEIVCDELRGHENAESRYHRLSSPLLYQGTPYFDKHLGQEREINNVTQCPPQTFRDFYYKWYQPQNMSLTVIGDIDPDKVIPVIEKHFSSTPSGALVAPDHRYKMPSPTHPKFLCFADKELEGSRGTLTYQLPPVPAGPITTVQQVKENLLDDLIKNAMNWRLYEMWTSAKTPFISAGIQLYDTIPQNPCLRAWFAAKEGEILSSFKFVLLELKRLKQHGMDPKEFTIVKQKYRSAIDHFLEEAEKVQSDQIANNCTDHFHQVSSLASKKTQGITYSKLLDTITLEEINKRIRYLLQHDNCLVGITQPKKPEVDLVSNNDLIKVMEEIKKESVAPYQYQSIDQPLLSHLPKPGKIVETLKYPISNVTKYTLENGITVYTKHTTLLNDSITMFGFALRGTRDTKLEERLSAKFCESFFSECGLGKFTKVELEKILAGKHASLFTYITDYFTEINASARKTDLKTAFEMLYTLFTHPHESQQAFETALTNLKEQLQNKTPDTLFSEEIKRTTTQDHPEFQPFSLENLGKIDYDTCKKISKDFYKNPSDFTFIISGNYAEEEIEGLITQYLGSLPTNGKKLECLTFPAIPFPKGITRKHVDAANSRQNSQNLLIFPISVSNSVLENCLSAFSSLLIMQRLSKALRYKLGFSYDVRCSIGRPQIPEITISHPPTANIQFTCHPDQAASLEKEILKEIQNLQTINATEQEINDCKTGWKELLNKEFQIDVGWIRYIFNRILWKRDLENINQAIEIINALTPDMAKEHIKKRFDLNNYAALSLSPSPTPAGKTEK